MSLPWARPFAVLTLLGVLGGCGGERTSDAPPQMLGDVEVRVESRPSPSQIGMNEFLVMVTGVHSKPISNLVVSLRTDERDAWRQAIQDGEVGVYRRAVEVAPGTRSVLQVQIKHDGTENVLRFPLKLEAQ